MGGFYGSAQVRSEDRGLVRQVAEEVARAKGIKCLLGPALRGWVGVYPEFGGQDHTVGEEIAQRLGLEVLYLLVHDDDVMAYWLWRGGELADSYWSAPGYFGEDQREEQEAMGGRPEVFGPLLRKGPQPMRELLRRDREQFAVEMERLEKFARLLDIPNAVTSYDYLKQGETEGIRGWKQFEELPAEEIDKEKRAAQEKRKLLNALKRQLKSAGLLLTEVTVKDDIYRVCSVESGFAVTCSGAMPGAAKPVLQFYSSPWKTPRSVPLDMTPQGNRMASDSGGHRVAAALGRRWVVWDAQDWRVLREVSESDWAIYVALSADGRLVAHSSRQEIVLTDVDTGARVRTLPIDSERDLTFHPSGRYLLVATHDGFGMIGIDLQAERHWKEQEQVLSERVACRKFTSDGRWLCCGTNKGFRAYSWPAVLEANDEEMLAPVWHYDTDGNDEHGMPVDYIYAIAQEVGGPGVLFAGLAGKLFRMDFESGEVRCLLTMSEQQSIIEIMVSHDAQTVGIVSRSRLTPRKRRSGGSDYSTWSVWSYPRLLASDHTS
jgi:hypothetical protein